MEKKTVKELMYNNKKISLNKEITFYSDGSYERNGVIRYGNSNGNYLKMSLYDINGKEHKVFLHTLMLCIFVSDRPSEEHEVDHIDRNKCNNAVSNLRWVTRKLNIENKTETKKLGELQFIKLFHDNENKYNLSYDVVHHRIFNLNWTFDKAMNTPLIQRNDRTEGRIKGNEKRKTDLRKWYDKQENKNVSYKTFYARVKRYGYTKEEAISKT